MILIVDDKKENIFSLKSLLELHNFSVDTAMSGEDALKKILKSTYSLIILDVQMPGMDGFEVAEAISGHSKTRDIPIIFLSAVNTEKKFITKGYTSGGIDYITKPFDPDLMLLKVKSFYRLSEQARELNETHRALKVENDFRKEAESKLSHNLEELRSILESIPQIAFTTNVNGEIEFVNEHWFNYTTSKDLFPQADDNGLTVEFCLQKAIRGGEQLQFEISIKPLNSNQYRYHVLTMTPVKNEKTVSKWVGVFTDIHEQRMANQLLEQRVLQRTWELQKTNFELETSNHDLQQYASIASHDLKEPLRKIQVFSRMIRDKHLHENKDALSYINRIILSSERMTSLINDLLSYSGLSDGGRFSIFDLNVIVNEILSDLELLVKEKNALIVVTGLSEIEVIPGLIRQVFQNIISNALKFSKKDVAPVIKVSSENVQSKSFDAPALANGKYCRLTIADNGIGFDEIYLDKIFTIFQRLNSKEEYEGTGIGLAIVKKIIDKHNGIITARSTENNGATFIIVLPAIQENSF
ncbi:hybrid sensor histidine kinase/response regulator [Flavitalea sp.]|nr:response regulator [Flavitalea sp.]